MSLPAANRANMLRVGSYAYPTARSWRGRSSLIEATVRPTLFSSIGYDTSLFFRLVLVCIETKFCIQIRILQHFSKSTKLSSWIFKILQILQNFKVSDSWNNMEHLDDLYWNIIVDRSITLSIVLLVFMIIDSSMLFLSIFAFKWLHSLHFHCITFSSFG